MADQASTVSGGISEGELACAICTEILYQPLTLLDCLHSFCGACLKEWFKWQATSASHNRRTTNPYTCPSCRESVMRAKADWRLNTLLEGFLKAHPDKAKSEEEKNELSKHYKPGDDVLPPLQVVAEENDSEDERLLAEVRELSMADVDPNAARRRTERQNARRRRREQYSPEELGRRQQPSRWAAQQVQLTEARLREHESGQHVEHQPSLRSLLSASDAEPQDVQAEILQSILADGLLDGIDIDHLTPEQEEELTERIAEAYRRRQRHRDRSGHQEHRPRDSRSSHSSHTGVERQSPRVPQQEVHNEQQQQSRSRPPISRPHLLQQTSQDPARTRVRSSSATSQRSNRSENRSEGAHSATDLSQQPSTENSQRDRRSRSSNTGRSITDPETGAIREQMHQSRANNIDAADVNGTTRPPSSDSRSGEAVRRSTQPAMSDTTSLSPSTHAPTLQPPQTVRPALSNSAFAPEPLSDNAGTLSGPAIQCNRCNKADIRYDLHYNCRWCRDGAYNLCLSCYRNGRGCDHWFGFGFRAYDRWYRNAPPEGWPVGFERPHILTPRRYVRPTYANNLSREDKLDEGAFCDSCFTFANDCYWYCNVCLEGAWGFCDTCVKQGRHCTHPLLVVAHINTVQGGHCDPTKLSFIGLPHLRQDTFVNLPLSTGCDICQRPIPPNSTRFHCYQCSDGDYDVCTDCYRSLVAQGKISQMNGTNGWRRCLSGHRMAVIGFQDTAEGGHVRVTVREPVGGWALKEDDVSLGAQLPPGGLPPDGGAGKKCLATYSYFPKDGVTDELAFPKNAEIREVEDKNGDWFVGVYAGALNLFPSNHVRIL